MFFVSTSNITKLSDKSNSYSFEYQKNSYFILGCTAVVQEGNIRKTMAARGLVNGRDPRSGRDLVFRCYPPELFSPPPKKQKLTCWVSLIAFSRRPISSVLALSVCTLCVPFPVILQISLVLSQKKIKFATQNDKKSYASY